MGEQNRPPRPPFPDPIPGDDRMESKRLLADLRQMYGRTKSEEPSAAPMSVLDQLNARRESERKRLEGMHPTKEILPEREVRDLMNARREAQRIVDRYEAQVSLLTRQLMMNSPEFKRRRRELYRDAMREVETHFDSLPLWKAKFSTDSASGGGGFSEPVGMDVAIDSVYFLTPSNMAIRLKKIVAEDPSYTDALDTRGLKIGVCAPAAKLIFGEPAPDDERQMQYQTEPKIGSSVKDFFTKEWMDFLDRGLVSGNLDPGITFFQDDAGVIQAFGFADNQAVKVHDGDRVNRIYFAR